MIAESPQAPRCQMYTVLCTVHVILLHNLGSNSHYNIHINTIHICCSSLRRVCLLFSLHLRNNLRIAGCGRGRGPTIEEGFI